jgi:hypothetical protein
VGCQIQEFFDLTRRKPYSGTVYCAGGEGDSPIFVRIRFIDLPCRWVSGRTTISPMKTEKALSENALLWPTSEPPSAAPVRVGLLVGIAVDRVGFHTSQPKASPSGITNTQIWFGRLAATEPAVRPQHRHEAGARVSLAPSVATARTARVPCRAEPAGATWMRLRTDRRAGRSSSIIMEASHRRAQEAAGVSTGAGAIDSATSAA